MVSSIRDEVVTSVCTGWINNTIQLYTVRGEIIHKPPGQVTFSIPGMILPAELDPILPYLPESYIEIGDDGMPHETESSVPREKGGPLIRKMLHLNRLVDDFYRKHAYRCEHIWELMLEDGYTPRISLEAIALKVFECKDPASITTPMLWCLNRVVENNETFRKDRIFHRLTTNFTMLPPERVHSSQRVQEWVRAYQENLASGVTAAFDNDPNSTKATHDANVVPEFVKKARALIKESRKSRDASSAGCLGPYKSPVKGINIHSHRERFSKTEACIVHSIASWVLSDAVSGPACSTGPAILRSVGMYEGFNFDKATGMLFLQEMGVLLPWENRALYFSESTQPLLGCGLDVESDEIHEQATNALPSIEDSMSGFRKDWGDLPVFCIDPLATTEREDGLSWEAIDESTGWVHVHVANPSAFVDPASVTAQFAAKLSKTLYLPEYYLQMLQPESINNHCSLAPNSTAITFSAKLTALGEVLETKIAHSTLRNVRIITYEEISQVLFPNEPATASGDVRKIGGGVRVPIVARASRDKSLTEVEVGSLRKLLEFGRARRLRRIEDTTLRTEEEFTLSTAASVYFGETKPPPGFSPHNTRAVVGDPVISLRVQPFDPKRKDCRHPSFEFVADLMVLAGEVASSWCSARGIPIAYIGTDSDPHLALTRKNFLEDVYEPTVAEHGYCPPHVRNRHENLKGRATISAEPRRHESLNLPSYSRVTSPLRRYSDLFSHWQIDAAIRQEACTGTSLLGNTDDSFLPFSASKSKEILGDITVKVGNHTRMAKQCRRHWALQWFHRAYYHNEAPLPRKMLIYIIRIDYARLFAQAMILELGLRCTVQAQEFIRVGGLAEGDTWEANVDELDCYALHIKMRLLKLVEKSPIEYQSWMVPKVNQ